MYHGPLQELLAEIDRQWEGHYEEVCVGVNWNLFPDGCEDVKVTGLLGNRIKSITCCFYSVWWCVSSVNCC